MKLKSVRVQNYRSVEDSGKFDVEDITCLVGKNESGKTAVLKALEGLKPVDKSMKYDKDTDYPKRLLHAYDADHGDSPAEVCAAEWELNDEDIDVLEEEFGPKCLEGKSITTRKCYDKAGWWTLAFNEKSAFAHICKKLELGAEEEVFLSDCQTSESAHRKISESEEEVTDKLTALKDHIDKYRGKRATLAAIDLLRDRMPSFVYFSHYSRMSGDVSIQKYKEDVQNENVAEGDKVFNHFLNYANLSLDEIESTGKHTGIKARLETASNDISDQIFEYWSQSEKLEVEITVDQGREEDTPPFNSGTVVHAHIRNTAHRVSVPFSERSAGFVWFFSFLAYFSQVQKHHGAEEQNLIVLLDEPGLTLHAKAQMDLLRYIKDKLSDKYQVVYTTHSPFMIFEDGWDTIRTVEYVGEEDAEGAAGELGTKVSADLGQRSSDTMFPLQGALGYELSQTLFIGKKILIVEGVSDMVYLRAMAKILQKHKKNYLDGWVLCPVGGIGNIRAFVNFFLSNSEERKIVVLADSQKRDEKKIQKLQSSEDIFSVLLYSEFCSKREADVEDMFRKSLYLEILKESCGITVDDPSTIDSEKRIISELRSKGKEFQHKRPAMLLLQKPDILTGDTADANEALARFENLFVKVNEEKPSRVGTSKKKSKRT